MGNREISALLSFLAGGCFLLSYLFGSKEDILKLLLGFLWLSIGSQNVFLIIKKKNKDNEKKDEK